jgi:hypothetical protein
MRLPFTLILSELTNVGKKLRVLGKELLFGEPKLTII